ncbi:MAG: hypothetical protein FJW56_07970, partial [Actinobacteria bacterium]|nr:hypothetical protein [Actinomycetota bacterium]
MVDNSKTSRKKILLWEMWGILFIFLSGAFFHFIFELSGGNAVVGLIGAVNESVWEHIKIGFWPAFILAVIEFFLWGRRTKNFLIAKGISFIIIGVSITGIYYLVVYLGIENLAVDITNFFISIAVAQVISYRLILIQRHHTGVKIIGAVLILASLTAFCLLSYFAPDC